MSTVCTTDRAGARAAACPPTSARVRRTRGSPSLHIAGSTFEYLIAVPSLLYFFVHENVVSEMPKIKPKPQPLKGDGERAIPQSSSTDENTDTEAPSSLASLAERRWRSQDIIFAFGPDNSFFVSIAPGQYRWSLRPQIANVLRRQSINRTAALVLTPHGDCIAVYEQDEDGSMPVQNISSDMMIPAAELTAWAEARKQYDRLYDFLRKTNDTNEKRMVSFCVGPKASWFARRGEEVAYHDIPDGLVKKIRERRTEGIHPFQVTLGMHGSYVVVWSDESCSWELHGYEKLVPYLREKDDSVNSVALSPLKCDEWILVQDSGHVLWTLKGNATQLELVAQECRTYMQRAARRTGKTISTIQSGMFGSLKRVMEDYIYWTLIAQQGGLTTSRQIRTLTQIKTSLTFRRHCSPGLASSSPHSLL